MPCSRARAQQLEGHRESGSDGDSGSEVGDSARKVRRDDM